MRDNEVRPYLEELPVECPRCNQIKEGQVVLPDNQTRLPGPRWFSNDKRCPYRKERGIGCHVAEMEAFRDIALRVGHDSPNNPPAPE